MGLGGLLSAAMATKRLRRAPRTAAAVAALGALAAAAALLAVRRGGPLAPSALAASSAPALRSCWGAANEAEVTVVTLLAGVKDASVASALRRGKVAWARAFTPAARYCEFSAPLDASRLPTWSKLLVALSVMECSSTRWVLVLDADLIVRSPGALSPGALLERVAAEARRGEGGGPGLGNLSFVFSKDYIGGSPLNMGAFLARNSPDARGALLQMYNDAEMHGIVPLSNPPSWGEQVAAHALRAKRRADFDSIAAIVSSSIFNAHFSSVNDPAVGGDAGVGRSEQQTFAVHYAGMYKAESAATGGRYAAIVRSEGLLGSPANASDGAPADEVLRCGGGHMRQEIGGSNLRHLEVLPWRLAQSRARSDARRCGDPCSPGVHVHHPFGSVAPAPL